MYAKNAASPAPIYAAVVSVADGSPITSGVAAWHHAGTTRTEGAGTLAHVANGKWCYTPTQAETDYDAFAVEFHHADAVGDGPVVEVATDRGIAFSTLTVSDIDARLAAYDAPTKAEMDAALAVVVERTARIPDSPSAVGSAMTLGGAEREALADALLSRSVASIETTAAEHSLCTVILGILESAVIGAEWTIRRTDGSTTHLVKQVTADSAAEPITGVS